MYIVLQLVTLEFAVKSEAVMKKGETSTTTTTNNGTGNKIERKTIEKNRRTLMKNLCYKLVSLIPPHQFNPSKDFFSQNYQLEQAAYYIKDLKERIEELKRRKTQITLLSSDHQHATNDNTTETENPHHVLPVLKLRDLGSSLEVIFISGLKKNIKLHQIIGILEEQGAEVITVSLSKIGDKIFHTLHAQAKVSRVGVDTSRICEIFEELIYF